MVVVPAAQPSGAEEHDDEQQRHAGTSSTTATAAAAAAATATAVLDDDNDASDGGYSSDISKPEPTMMEEGSSSVTTSSDSSESLECFRLFDSDNDSLDDTTDSENKNRSGFRSLPDKIAFLREKQAILERVSHILHPNSSEACYLAAKATAQLRLEGQAATGVALPSTGSGIAGIQSCRSNDNDDDNDGAGTVVVVEPPIWTEARRLLTVLGKKSGVRRTPQSTTSSSRKRSAPNPSNPLIATTSVQWIHSDKYEITTTTRPKAEKGTIRNFPSATYREDQVRLWRIINVH